MLSKWAKFGIRHGLKGIIIIHGNILGKKYLKLNLTVNLKLPFLLEHKFILL